MKRTKYPRSSRGTLPQNSRPSQSPTVLWASLLGLFVVILSLGIWFVYWSKQPLPLMTPSVEFTIAKGASSNQTAQTVINSGVDSNPIVLKLWLKFKSRGKSIKAGSYKLHIGDTPEKLTQKLINGEQFFRTVTLIEGWTFRKALGELAKAPNLKQEVSHLTDAQIMEKLERKNIHPEGRFFPDTYQYTGNDSDLTILKQALLRMDKMLATAWDMRSSYEPLKTPDELLVLASIIEKETASDSDRQMISSVFHNRLRIGMKLQTDPTVFYGAGTVSGGNWKAAKANNNPYNTYMYAGLPPTPIALPSKASLLAAAQPASSNALYFVSKNDGSGDSQFSSNLQDHNRAIAQSFK